MQLAQSRQVNICGRELQSKKRILTCGCECKTFNDYAKEICCWGMEDWDYSGFIITGKWFNYGIMFCVMVLDMNNFKNQVLYDPQLYGQYTDNDTYIWSITKEHMSRSVCNGNHHYTDKWVSEILILEIQKHVIITFDHHQELIHLTPPGMSTHRVDQPDDSILKIVTEIWNRFLQDTVAYGGLI